MLTLDTKIGMSIDSAIHEMIEMANDRGEPVQTEFNGVGLIAEPGVHPDTLMHFWQSEMDRAAIAYRESPAGRQATADAGRRLRSDQRKLDTLMGELPSLDFTDLAAAIGWMDRLTEPADHIGVILDRPLILDTFTKHGYERNVNIGHAFDGENRENFARYLIGQGLAGIASVGAPHPVFRRMASEWRAKFAMTDGES